MSNPYRTDLPGAGPFVGRQAELDTLAGALLEGRQSIAAVMGGRGMGKTTLAIKLKERLGAAAPGTSVILDRRPPRDPVAFLERLGARLGHRLDPRDPVGTLVDAVESSAANVVVLMIDEVESLLSSRSGVDLLNNLRIAYEALAGRLGIVVFGGSGLRRLLQDDTSPFLRTARWLPLRALTLGDTEQLVRDPGRVPVPDDLVRGLWAQTGGQPLLLQSVLERLVTSSKVNAATITDAAAESVNTRLAATVFPLWWDNVGEDGQRVYSTLLRASAPILWEQRAAALGPNPAPWIEVLETTGLASRDGGTIIPTCTMFSQWANAEGLLARRDRGGVASCRDERLPAGDASQFEGLVLRSITRWAQAVEEFPGHFVRRDGGSGNGGLRPEQDFQLSLLFALRQTGYVVEAEALSGQRGRSDVKVRLPTDLSRRACVELKIWGRNDYAEVVQQVLGYAGPADRFACAVMIARRAGPLLKAYEATCLSGAAVDSGCPPLTREPGQRARHPATTTRHTVAGGSELRIHHFIIELPPSACIQHQPL